MSKKTETAGKKKKMVTKLTKKQMDIIPSWIEKYTNEGLSTEPCDPVMCAKDMDAYYVEILGREKPKGTVLMPSPMEAWKAVCVVADDDLMKRVRKDPMTAEYFAEIIRTEKINILEFVWPYNSGSFWIAWKALYKYMEEVVGVEITVPTYQTFLNTLGYGPIWSLNEYCIVSDHPESISRNRNNMMHCESGPAIRYRDGFELYYLNGVCVDKDIVMTPAMELDPRLVLTEDNAEVRREIVYKIGIERVCSKLGARVIDSDKKRNYELLLLNDRPYLKMVNPSIGTYHIEGVPRGTETVLEALHSRLPEWAQKLKKDDKNGEDWYQQGDVVIVPEDAKSIKTYPAVMA